MSIYDTRITHVRESMRQQEIEALIITPSSDFYYLTGLSISPSQRIVCLIITHTELHLFAPDFELFQLRSVLSEISRKGWTDTQDPFERLSALLPRTGLFALGREMKTGWALALQERIAAARWCCADLVLAPLRRVKDLQELALIQRAQQMAEHALENLFSLGLQGRTEREISRLLMRLRLEAGFAAVGEGIVASGPNSACPHHRSTDRIIQPGDVLMLDIGGEYEGYRADMTRTVAIARADTHFREIYEIVLEAHMAAIDAVSPGVCCQSVDSAARTVISRAGYGDFFVHRLGHGIGIDVHEEPFISESSQHILEIGNVFSDEPGIYLPNSFGVRIEDLLAVTEQGVLVLNKLNKQLIVVD